MIATDLNKRQALDADPKAMQQANFIVNLNRSKNSDGQDINDDTTMIFIAEEAKETISDFSQGTLSFNVISVQNDSM